MSGWKREVSHGLQEVRVYKKVLSLLLVVCHLVFEVTGRVEIVALRLLVALGPVSQTKKPGTANLHVAFQQSTLVFRGKRIVKVQKEMEVNGYFQKVCSTEEFWRSRIVGTKIDEDLSSKQNVLSAERKKVYVQPLVEPVRLKGDYVIIDPFRTLFGSLVSARVELEHQLHDLQQQNHWVFLVKYRNQTAYFISADNYDPEPAFEISRDGTTLGVHEHPSRFIGVFTKKTVDQLLKESGEDKGTIPEGGVSVEGVDGELICSGDGDFVISGSPHSPGRKVSRWIEDDCVRDADVLCAAGGRWTFCDDSSDEDDEDEGDGEITDEEMYLDQEDIERCRKQDLDLRWNPQGAPFHFEKLSSRTHA